MKPKIGHYSMFGDIDTDMSYDFSHFYKKAIKKKLTHVLLNIDTLGGYCSDMNTICSLIELPGIEWHGCVTGMAYSAGIFILRSCDYAYATERSDMMFHDDNVSVDGDAEAVHESMDHLRKISAASLKMFADKTKKDSAWWIKSTYMNPSNQILLTPKKALKLGVVDVIGQPMLSVKKKHVLDINIISI